MTSITRAFALLRLGFWLKPAVIFLLTLSGPASFYQAEAGDYENRVAIGIGQSAGEAWVTQTLNDNANSIAGHSCSEFGSKLMGSIGVLTAAHQFFSSDNNQQRTLAAAHGIVSAVSIGNPLAGLVCGICLTAVELISTRQAIENQLILAEIQKRTFEYLTTLVDIQGSMAKRESEELNFNINVAQRSGLKIGGLQTEIKQSCLNPEGVSNLDQGAKCINWAVDLVHNIRTLNDSLKSILRTPRQFIPLSKILEMMGFTEAQLVGEIDENEKTIATLQNTIEASTRAYLADRVAARIQEIKKETQPTEVEKWIRFCERRLSNYAVKVADWIRLKHPRRMSSKTTSSQRSTLDILIQKINRSELIMNGKTLADLCLSADLLDVNRKELPTVRLASYSKAFLLALGELEKVEE